MKIQGHGQAAILSSAEERRLFVALGTERDRAVFGICLYCGCRISEALQLQVQDVSPGAITFRKGTTKGKQRTRQVPMAPRLAMIVANYERPTEGYLFPGRQAGTYLKRGRADQILREATQKAGLAGISTHSFRRTALTRMHNAGVPLAVIREISGHRTLAALQRYLEVEPQQMVVAVGAI